MRRLLNPTVLVAGLGYFVDMFDITLFGAVRTASLRALGIVDHARSLEIGIRLFNAQMIGMLLGGLLWGILGDKKGRVTVLYGSILLYSLANLANAFVTNVETYMFLRFLAGFGLAGELGAAVTLVSEGMSKEDRGYGTTIVATLGMGGSVAAALAGKYLAWNHAYFLGGVLGLLLLISRARLFDSGMFRSLREKKVPLGSVALLLRRERLPRYLAAIAVGVPIYFITGILLTLSPELTADMNLSAPVTAADALFYGSIGLAMGDMASGLLSQWMKSRKRAIALFLAAALALIQVYVNARGFSAPAFYAVCFGLGGCAGFWAVLVTTAAEQFGTNIRSTVATSVPNFVRGSAVLTATAFLALKDHFGQIGGLRILTFVCFGIAFAGLWVLEETYGKNLDYAESD
ncbi:MAG: MFS transporter [Elusimicrobia bacterium]|nr:MFS transporter [Elusimicrobiota bacterium]